MAGSYPDVPGRRMAWDADGTILFYQNVPSLGSRNLDGAWGTSTTPWNEVANDESDSNHGWEAIVGSSVGYAIFCWIFPETRDVYGLFGAAEAGYLGAGGLRDAETSTNTTNGIDGDWSEIISSGSGEIWYSLQDSWPDRWRNDIDSSFGTASGVRGLEAWLQGRDATYLKSFHIYGEIAAGQTPHRLLFIDTATGLEFAGPIDWGDVPRGTVHDRTLWVKNNSSILTATNVTLSFEDLYLGSSTWYTIKETSGSFATTLDIDEILPAATYPVAPSRITVRATVAIDEDLGTHAARLKAVTSTWGFYADVTGSATVETSLSVT